MTLPSLSVLVDLPSTEQGRQSEQQYQQPQTQSQQGQQQPSVSNASARASESGGHHALQPVQPPTAATGPPTSLAAASHSHRHAVRGTVQNQHPNQCQLDCGRSNCPFRGRQCHIYHHHHNRHQQPFQLQEQSQGQTQNQHLSQSQQHGQSQAHLKLTPHVHQVPDSSEAQPAKPAVTKNLPASDPK